MNALGIWENLLLGLKKRSLVPVATMSFSAALLPEIKTFYMLECGYMPGISRCRQHSLLGNGPSAVGPLAIVRITGIGNHEKHEVCLSYILKGGGHVDIGRSPLY